MSDRARLADIHAAIEYLGEGETRTDKWCEALSEIDVSPTHLQTAIDRLTGLKGVVYRRVAEALLCYPVEIQISEDYQVDDSGSAYSTYDFYLSCEELGITELHLDEPECTLDGGVDNEDVERLCDLLGVERSRDSNAELPDAVFDVLCERYRTLYNAIIEIREVTENEKLYLNARSGRSAIPDARAAGPWIPPLRP